MFKSKLVLPAALLVLLALFGAQGSTAAAPAPAAVNSGDGEITAEEVRTLIFNASDAPRTQGRITPRVANMSAGHLALGSVSCEKGRDWYWFKAFTGRDGGTLCNGDRQWRKTRKFGPHYFQRKMRSILNYILIEASLESLGEGKPTEIRSKGKVATLRFQKARNGKPTNSFKELRIVGSTIEVTDLG